MIISSYYKSYKLYEVTEQDVADTGGVGESRLIRNSVLIFLPDEQNPELGKEVYHAASFDGARQFIDTVFDIKSPMNERMQVAIEKSKAQEKITEQQRNVINNEKENRDYKEKINNKEYEETAYYNGEYLR